MTENKSIPELSGGMDLLLSHQAQRLEDIANNSISYLRINLLTLGLLTPIISVLLDNSQSVANVFKTNYGILGLISWSLSMIICTHVYRSARKHSTKQFKPLEDAIEEYKSKPSELTQSIADGNKDYEKLSEKLMRRMSLGISSSFIAILLLITAFISNFVSLKSSIIYSLALLGFLAVLGIETIKYWVITPIMKPINYIRLLIPEFEFNISKEDNSRKFRIANSLLNFIAEFKLDNFAKPLLHTLGIKIERKKLGSVQITFDPAPMIPFDTGDQKNTISLEFANNDLEFKSIQLGEKISSVEDLPPIRSRLLASIWHIAGKNRFTIQEIKANLEDTDIPANRTILERLMAENYVERISYNQTHIFIDEFDDKILFTGEDINSLVQERIQSFIQQKNSDERVKEIAQEVLDVEESEVEEEINSLGATESAQRLDRIVEKMKENGIEPEGYGRLGWRSQMSKYKLTSKAVKIIEKIQENK